MPTNESRHYARIHFNASVHLKIHLLDDIRVAHLIDISLKGALVETDNPIAAFIQLRNCIMTLALGSNDASITMQGRIVHHEGRLIGLEAMHMDIDSMTNLRRLIQLNTGNNILLETELSYMLKSYEKSIHSDRNG